LIQKGFETILRGTPSRGSASLPGIFDLNRYRRLVPGGGFRLYQTSAGSWSAYRVPSGRGPTRGGRRCRALIEVNRTCIRPLCRAPFIACPRRRNRMLIADSHLDLSWNALQWNRDLLRSVYTIRAQEEATPGKGRGQGPGAVPEMRPARIALSSAA